MGVKVIGVDPHKRSHTAVMLDDNEEIEAQLRVVADRRQVDRLLSWAGDWPERIWAVENANGLGRLLSQQLVMAGEQVVDVPASLSHRTRKLSGKSARKTDEHDARSVAITAAHPGRLRTVELEDFSQALGLILDRRWHLVTFRHRTICRLHALLAEMVPGGPQSSSRPSKRPNCCVPCDPSRPSRPNDGRSPSSCSRTGAGAIGASQQPRPGSTKHSGRMAPP
jgi:transposase